ncbi:MAG TPA: hypothetical protein VIY98_12585 [Nitrososphaeraceae archaeon]
MPLSSLPFLPLPLLDGSVITNGKVLPILINKSIFLSESNFRPLLDFSRVTDISYNPPSASNLLFNVTGFFELTSTRSLFGICSFSLFFGIIS